MLDVGWGNARAPREKWRGRPRLRQSVPATRRNIGRVAQQDPAGASPAPLAANRPNTPGHPRPSARLWTLRVPRVAHGTARAGRVPDAHRSVSNSPVHSERRYKSFHSRSFSPSPLAGEWVASRFSPASCWSCGEEPSRGTPKRMRRSRQSSCMSRAKWPGAL